MSIVNPVGVPIYGPSTPYITPPLLIGAGTGISWSNFPTARATAAEKFAAVLNVCARASDKVDARLNTPARATISVEQFVGPGAFNCQIRPNGTAWLLASRNPVTAVLGGRMSAAAAFPRSWQDIDADQFEPAYPIAGLNGSTAPGPSGDGGQAIILAPGWLTWWAGREGTLIEATIASGWPHTSNTVAAAAGATSLTVDDITAWSGATGVLYDEFQETFRVTAVTPAVTDAVSGPGTLTLATALSYPHLAGTMASTLPANIQLAAVYLAVAEGLMRGTTATAVQSTSGSNTGGGPAAAKDYVAMAYELLDNVYGRVI